MAQVKKNTGADVVKIRDLNPPRVFATESDFSEFIALALNSIKINCKDPLIKFGYLEQKFIKEQLIYTNYVGYDKITNMWAKCVAYGLNDYWKPNKIAFIYPNRKGYTRDLSYEPKPFGAYMIEGYPGGLTLANVIKKATDTMQICDELILQNLEACKTPHYVLVKDKETRLSLEQAIQQRQSGMPVILLDATLGDCMKGVENLTPFIAPEVYQLKQKYKDNLLNKLATLTANIDKRERVQVGEVNAMVGVCEDYIYSMIDNVNTQFIEYALPYEMELNTSLEELYANIANDENIEEEVTDNV